MAVVELCYWAGARAAAGIATESVEAATVAAALQAARDRRRNPAFDRVLGISSLLIDGRVAHADDLTRPLAARVRVEVLPPFAGGGR